MTSLADHLLLPSGEAPAAAPPKLPAPQSERFRPLRCGLINLYRYDYQEFVFEQGRLLLRGNNGTGKSRVLALTLPFLLDGEVGAHRLEPDGDPARRIEWNLLLGGKYSDRTGYAFLEFGRKGSDGEQFVTLGCGLHAASGAGLVGKWFFLTRQRIGRELFLVARGGYPLGRERLTESIGGHGQVFTNASQYRQRVDQELFQLGTQRYEALIGLLIQLRKPQLSRQLDEKALSRALSEALAPLPESVLSTVADAFHSLERDRVELADYQAAEVAVSEFLTHYERYAQTVTRRRAGRVRSAHAAYEDAQRSLREAEKQHDAASARLAELKAEQHERDRRELACEEEVRVLSSRPELADGARIESERRRAEQLEQAAGRAHDEAGRAQAATVKLGEQCTEAEVAARTAAARAESAAQATEVAAERADLTLAHKGRMAELQPLSGCDEEAARKIEQALREAAEQKQRGATELRKLHVEFTRSQSELGRASEALQERQTDLDNRRTQEAEARDAVFTQRELLAGAYRTFHASAQELRPAEPDAVLAQLPDWVEAGRGQTPVAQAVRAAEKEAIVRLSAAAQRAALAGSEAQARRDALQAERQRVAEARHLPPLAPPTRSVEGRQARPGAPLWALCDFRPEVPAPIRAQIEAALEAAGLLDAWLSPDGKLLQAGTYDTALVVAGEQPARRGPHLGQLLLPAIDPQSPQAAAVAEATVAALLSQIGLGSPPPAEREAPAGTPVWVDEAGRFRLGPLTGQWHKSAAQHIGDAARQASRRQRLLELDAQLAQAAASVAAHQAEQAQVQQRREQAQREIDGAPDDRALIAAIDALTRARLDCLQASERFAVAEARTVTLQKACAARQAERDALAAELGLLQWLERLDELKEALGQYREALGRFFAGAQNFFLLRRHAARFAELLAEAQAEEARQRTRSEEAAGQAAAARRGYELLEQTVGAEFRRVQEQLLGARQEQQELRKQKKVAEKEHEQEIGHRARAAADVERHGAAMQAHVEARGQAIAQLRTLDAEQLLALAVPLLVVPLGSEDWSVTRAVDLCRELEQQLVRIDAGDEAWQRRRNEIYAHAKKVEEALSRRGQKTSLYEVDEVFVVSAQLAERLVPMASLRASLTRQVEERQALLSQREREVLENHLLSEVAHELHDRIQQAESQVAEMNRELEARPTTMGIKLRFVWSPGEGAPPGLANIRKLLLRAVGVWSPAERRAVADFLQQQIKRARDENSIGTWLEHLSTAFDYRAWHQFVIERHQDGTWQRLTRKSFGTGSGGEKAVALTLPQVAAAAAHYRSASPHAPRLILLDEVFAGIDRKMRSQCMALLRDFELDFVMTSENEWACYATLPGVAICHLTAREGIDAVAVSRWVWTGRERQRAEAATPPLHPEESKQDLEAVGLGPRGAA